MIKQHVDILAGHKILEFRCEEDINCAVACMSPQCWDTSLGNRVPIELEGVSRRRGYRQATSPEFYSLDLLEGPQIQS